LAMIGSQVTVKVRKSNNLRDTGIQKASRAEKQNIRGQWGREITQKPKSTTGKVGAASRNQGTEESAPPHCECGVRGGGGPHQKARKSRTV